MLFYKRNYELALLALVLICIGLIIVINIFNSVNYIKIVKQSELSSSGAGVRETSLADRVKALIDCRDEILRYEKVQYGKYWLLKNYIRGRLSNTMGCAQSITYTTIADFTFLDNLPHVVERWLAPVSLALFAPGYDFNSTMDSIQYLRNCLPQSDLIRLYVTFHIYFPNDHIPAYIPKSEDNISLWAYDCQKKEAPYNNVNRNKMYKTKKKLLYPINVGRNIARKAVNTYFILASDLELYPSRGFIQQFLEMIVDNKSLILDNNGTLRAHRVFPLPVFEIVKSALVPDNKLELMKMLKNRTAITFHLGICEICHTIPHYKEWLDSNYTQQLQIAGVSKREGKFSYWEPFYVSDNREPLFDERISWEGQKNKRIQNYAMCLLHYEYHILHPAFLIHAPGIKTFNGKDPRLRYVPATNRLIERTIKPEYQLIYGRNRKCTV